MQTKAEMLNDDVVELERIFDDHASPALREIWARLNADDREVGLVGQAVKAALLRAYATGQMATDDGWYREKLQDAGFMAGVRWNEDELRKASARRFFDMDFGEAELRILASDPVELSGKAIIAREKGPRPYHVSMREPTPEQAARWEAMRKTLGTFVGVDVARDGDETVITRASMDADGKINVIAVERHDFYQHPRDRRAHNSDCAVHNEPAMVAGNCTCGAQDASETGNEHERKGPCPHERMDDDGGPPRKDWDEFPKVGLKSPVDIMAITRSLSGG